EPVLLVGVIGPRLVLDGLVEGDADAVGGGVGPGVAGEGDPQTAGHRDDLAEQDLPVGGVGLGEPPAHRVGEGEEAELDGPPDEERVHRLGGTEPRPGEVLGDGVLAAGADQAPVAVHPHRGGVAAAHPVEQLLKGAGVDLGLGRAQVPEVLGPGRIGATGWLMGAVGSRRQAEGRQQDGQQGGEFAHHRWNPQTAIMATSDVVSESTPRSLRPRSARWRGRSAAQAESWPAGSPSAVMSCGSSIRSRPPGARVVTSRSSNAPGSGTQDSNARAWTRSNDAAGRATVVTSRRATSRLAERMPPTKRVSMSTARTRPAGPTLEHSHRVMDPPPAPTSRQRQPGPTPSASSRRVEAGSWIRSKARRACWVSSPAWSSGWALVADVGIVVSSGGGSASPTIRRAPCRL